MASRQRQIRKRQRPEDEGAAPEAEAEAPAQDIAALIQWRKRQAAQGISSDALTLGGHEGRLKAAADAGNTQLMAAYVKEEKKTPALAADEAEMERYIAEQVERRLGKKRAEEAQAAAKAEAHDKQQEADLYEIPKHLMGQQIVHHDENAHMTAILEIPLSAETKMRNIEDTEAAKHRLLESPSSSASRPVEPPPRRPEPRGLNRVIYPRDFGRVTDKDLARREAALRQPERAPRTKTKRARP